MNGSGLAESSSQAREAEVRIGGRILQLEGTLAVPPGAAGLVIFAHGSGSSRHSPRNRRVARTLQDAGIGTLLFDLLTKDEERSDALTSRLRFDIDFLAARLRLATQWARYKGHTGRLRIGYFGASTGAAAALAAAADPDAGIGAIVSRGGRPDLAGGALERVQAPTLLIVGGADEPVVPLNEAAFARLQGVKRLEIVPDATHLFEEPGALDLVTDHAARWFGRYLAAP